MFWSLQTIHIPIFKDVGSANLVLFLFTGTKTICWTLAEKSLTPAETFLTPADVWNLTSAHMFLIPTDSWKCFSKTLTGLLSGNYFEKHGFKEVSLKIYLWQFLAHQTKNKH